MYLTVLFLVFIGLLFAVGVMANSAIYTLAKSSNVFNDLYTCLPVTNSAVLAKYWVTFIQILWLNITWWQVWNSWPLPLLPALPTIYNEILKINSGEKVCVTIYLLTTFLWQLSQPVYSWNVEDLHYTLWGQEIIIDFSDYW